MKMKKKIITTSIGLLLFVMFIVGVSAAESFVFPTNSEVNLQVPVFMSDNSPVDSDVNCTLNMKKPNGAFIYTAQAMDVNTTTSEANITITLVDHGVNHGKISCTDGTTHGFSTFSILATPSGRDSQIGYYFLIILLIYGAFGLGIWKRDITITILATLGLYFIGIWVLFYGIDIYKNYLTDAFAWVTLGIAFYVSVRTSWELITS